MVAGSGGADRRANRELPLAANGRWGALVATVLFDSREHYEANAADPAQDAWYRELVTLVEADPTWADGDVLTAHSRQTVRYAFGWGVRRNRNTLRYVRP